MLLALSTPEYDLQGHVLLDALPATVLGDTRRRVNRIQTLDGGVVFNDFGHADGDRSVEIRWQPESAAQADNLERLVRDYTHLQLAQPGGVYLVVPEAITRGESESTLRLLVSRKLSA